MATKTIQTAQTTLASAFQTAREELQAFLQRGINLAEKRSKAAFRYARALTKRVGGARGRKTKRA